MKRKLFTIMLFAALIACLLPVSTVLAVTPPSISVVENSPADLSGHYGKAEAKNFTVPYANFPSGTFINAYWCGSNGDTSGTPASAGNLKLNSGPVMTLTLSTSATAEPGTYYFKVSGSEGTSSNIISYTVNKNKVTITGLTAKSSPYDGNAQAGYMGGAVMKDEEGNSYNSGGVAQTYYLADGTTKTTNANSGAASEGTAPVWAGGYVFTYSVNSTQYEGSLQIPFTIQKKDITISAQNRTIALNDTLPTLGTGDYTISGSTVGSDTLVLPSIAYDPAAPDTTQAGSATIVVSGAAINGGRPENYNIIHVNGTLTIGTPIPQTGDQESPMLWIISFLLFSLAGLGAAAYGLKKQ